THLSCFKHVPASCFHLCHLNEGGGIEHAGKVGDLLGTDRLPCLLHRSNRQSPYFCPLLVQQRHIGSITTQGKLLLGGWDWGWGWLLCLLGLHLDRGL